MVLDSGTIAEMRTGEGKTLTATLAVFLNTLAGDRGPPGHRQRLPRPPRRRVDEPDLRDARRLGRRDPVGDAPGTASAPSTPATSPTAPTPSSASTTCATTWPTRSRSACSASYAFAIVDEVDNILIDEARTPLIISGRPEQAADTYYTLRAPGQADGRRGDEAEAEVAGRVARHLRGEPRLRVRREAQDRRADRGRGRQGGELPRRRQPLRLRARHPGQPSDPVAEGRVVVQARHGLRGDRRRGQDHRRVHRPHPRGAALVGWPSPGGRGEGGRRGSARRTRPWRRSRYRTTSASTTSSPG